jgi:hypothetical protein
MHETGAPHHVLVLNRNNKASSKRLSSIATSRTALLVTDRSWIQRILNPILRLDEAAAAVVIATAFVELRDLQDFARLIQHISEMV